MVTTDIATAKQTLDRVLGQVSGYFVGNEIVLRKVLAAALAGGHVLLEDFPGMGKTLLVKLFSRTIGCSFARVQFTPDMLPADIIGTKIWQPGSGNFQTILGPVFTQVLLADEINRATPKTQSALLEAMEEKQVTIEGETRALPKPFLVLATQNPVEMEGTYPLPEAQLDRFAMRLTMGYPATLADESDVLSRRISWGTSDPTQKLAPVLDAQAFTAFQGLVEHEVYIDRTILDYISELVRGTREHPKVEMGVSPRGAVHLMNISRSLALLEGMDFVTPDHVKSLAVDVLAHRIVLGLEHALENFPSRTVVQEVVKKVPVPTDFRRKQA
ncbi:MAG: MoxR family ATPase [SAR202 cluster bacterium]|nr:MoxR family ATPase [SAR202 cluster bacterium]